MARPQKEGLDYFPHDTDADGDEKLQAMLYLYGNDGYAFYFRLLQTIYRSASGELDVSDPEMRQILSRNLGVTREKFERMLATALKKGLFDAAFYTETGRLTSNGIRKRIKVVMDKRAEMKARYAQKVGKSDGVSAAEKGVETPQTIKESKDKRESNKDEITTTPTPPETGLLLSSSSPAQEDAIVKCFQENIGGITFAVREEIRAAARRFPAAWVREAILETGTAAREKRSWRYAAGILKNWSEQGREVGPGDTAPPAVEANKYVLGKKFGHLVQS